MRIIAYIHDEDVIWRILNHLGLLEEETVGSSERAPPDCLPPVREITYEPFFDDLPVGEMDEDWLEAVMNVGARNQKNGLPHIGGPCLDEIENGRFCDFSCRLLTSDKKALDFR